MQQLPYVPLFSACGFSPLSKIVFPDQQSCRSLCFAACGFNKCSLHFLKPLQSSRENRLHRLGLGHCSHVEVPHQPKPTVTRPGSKRKAPGPRGEDAESERTCRDQTGGGEVLLAQSLQPDAAGADTKRGREHCERVRRAALPPRRPSPRLRRLGMCKTGEGACHQNF